MSELTCFSHLTGSTCANVCGSGSAHAAEPPAATYEKVRVAAPTAFDMTHVGGISVLPDLRERPCTPFASNAFPPNFMGPFDLSALLRPYSSLSFSSTDKLQVTSRLSMANK